LQKICGFTIARTARNSYKFSITWCPALEFKTFVVVEKVGKKQKDKKGKVELARN